MWTRSSLPAGSVDGRDRGGARDVAAFHASRCLAASVLLSLPFAEMGQLVAASLLILIGVRGLFGVSARWPPGHWSLTVRRGLGVAAIAYGVALIALEVV